MSSRRVSSTRAGLTSSDVSSSLAPWARSIAMISLPPPNSAAASRGGGREPICTEGHIFHSIQHPPKIIVLQFHASFSSALASYLGNRCTLSECFRNGCNLPTYAGVKELYLPPERDVMLVLCDEAGCVWWRAGSARHSECNTGSQGGLYNAATNHTALKIYEMDYAPPPSFEKHRRRSSRGCNRTCTCNTLAPAILRIHTSCRCPAEPATAAGSATCVEAGFQPAARWRKLPGEENSKCPCTAALHTRCGRARMDGDDWRGRTAHWRRPLPLRYCLSFWGPSPLARQSHVRPGCRSTLPSIPVRQTR